MYEDLRKHLDENAGDLSGPWVKLKSGYEKGACAALKIGCVESRYGDAKWGKYSIELKKGTSIWIDIVRYSEVLLKHPELGGENAVTLFLIPANDRESVSEIVCVPTRTIIGHLNLDADAAEKVLWLHARMPRQLNAQASLTVSDVKKLQVFSLDRLSGFRRGLN